MRVTGSLIEYFLFIEGVRVPISSLQVSVSVNAGARLHATIPPLPQGLLLTRGMKVALFKKVNNDKAYLRFHGLLITKNYSKTFGERHLSIDCASPDCRWATMVCSEMNKNSFTCTVVNSAVRVDTKAKKVSDAQKNYDSAREALQKATDENNEKHTEETEKKLTEATNAAHAAQVALSNAKLDTVNSGAINAGVSQYMGSSTRLDGYVKPVVLFPDTKNLSWDMSREFLQKNQKSYTTIYGVFQRALAGIDAGGAITTAEGEPNPLSAFKEVLATAYEASDDYTKREYDQMHMYNQMYTMPVFRTDQFRIYATEDTKYDDQGNLKSNSNNSPAAQQTTEYNFGQAILRMAEDMIGQQHAAFPLYSLISKMMDMFFCKVSVDPLKVDRSICFHPEMISCIPPKCNVIFPNMYNGISLNFNAWTEPTRSVISYPPALERASVLANTELGVLDDPEKALASSTSYIADTTDPYLAQATDLLYNQGKEYDKNKIKNEKEGFSKAVNQAFDNAKKAFGILTEEETMCGVVPNVAQIPFYPLSFASKEIQASLANFVHSMAKFSNRSCTVNCCLIDDMAVGMPVLLVDDVFSIHGILENYTYSVTPDGQIGCQASIAYPKMIFNGMDTIPQPPVWINSDNISVENIGSKVYSGLFGCNSMYDDEEVTFDNVNEITYKMAKIAAAVINRYNKAADKLLFVSDYRMRVSNISMEDYFKKILNCEPEFQAWDATAVKVWKAKSGEDGIFAVYNGGNGRASIGEAGDTINGTVTLQHTAVDKQQMVLNYVNAVYRGTVSGIIGGMLADGEREDDLIVTVRDDIPDVQSVPADATTSAVTTSSANNTLSNSVFSGYAKNKLPWNKVMGKAIRTIVQGHISSAFGPREINGSISTHHGVDIGGNVGAEVYSVTSGQIVRLGWENENNHAQGYGLRIYIKTGKLVYIYAHLNSIDPYLTVGTIVKKFQRIGTLGNTGKSYGAHLHFEINDGKNCYSPLSTLWTIEDNLQNILTQDELKMEDPVSYKHPVSF